MRFSLSCPDYSRVGKEFIYYDGKVSGKRGRGRPRLTFKNTVSKILEEDHVKACGPPGGHV